MVDCCVLDIWVLEQSCCRRRLGDRMQWYSPEDGRRGAGATAADETRSKRLTFSAVPLSGGPARGEHRHGVLHHLGEGQHG